MKWSEYLARLTAYALGGALIGLIVGLVLLGLNVVDNPFWAMSIGIFVGAMIMPLESAVSQRRRGPDAG